MKKIKMISDEVLRKLFDDETLPRPSWTEFMVDVVMTFSIVVFTAFLFFAILNG